MDSNGCLLLSVGIVFLLDFQVVIGTDFTLTCPQGDWVDGYQGTLECRVDGDSLSAKCIYVATIQFRLLTDNGLWLTLGAAAFPSCNANETGIMRCAGIDTLTNVYTYEINFVVDKATQTGNTLICTSDCFVATPGNVLSFRGCDLLFVQDTTLVPSGSDTTELIPTTIFPARAISLPSTASSPATSVEAPTITASIPNTTSLISTVSRSSTTPTSTSKAGTTAPPWDIQLDCGEGDWVENTTVTVTCYLLKSSYPSKCMAAYSDILGFSSYSSGMFLPVCRVNGFNSCSPMPAGQEGCGCVSDTSSIYTFQYTFIAHAGSAGSWDCSVHCTDVSLSNPLVLDTVSCEKNVLPGTSSTSTATSAPAPALNDSTSASTYALSTTEGTPNTTTASAPSLNESTSASTTVPPTTQNTSAPTSAPTPYSTESTLAPTGTPSQSSTQKVTSVASPPDSSTSFAPSECQEGKWGQNCNETCTCDQRNTEFCNKTNGDCACKPGFNGTNCDTDIDECRDENLYDCVSDSSCQNTNGGYICVCDDGYVKASDGNCSECPNNKYGTNCASDCTCDVLNTASCDKVTGACRCKSGWRGDTCTEDIDECAEGLHDCNSANLEECRDTDGGFDCVCQQGYEHYNFTPRICFECPEGQWGADCTGYCNCPNENFQCVKDKGDCICKPGYKGANCMEDIDECTESSTPPCGDNSDCSNSLPPTRFTCGCHRGFYAPYGNGTHCTDIDECVTNSVGCAQLCVNTDGSYICFCREDYRLASDGRTCLTNCVAGHFMDTTANICTPCPKGQYQDLTGQIDCKHCPPGTTTKDNGTTSLTDCEEPPSVKNTVSVSLPYVLLVVCTRELEDRVTTEVHAKIVVVGSDWSGMCVNSACSNAHVTTTCDGPFSFSVTSVIAIEEVRSVLTSSNTDFLAPTTDVLQDIIRKDGFDLQESLGATLQKNEISISLDWTCRPGYLKSQNTCEAVKTEPILSTVQIISIVGGCLGFLSLVLLVFFVRKRRRQNKRRNNQNDPNQPPAEHLYDSLAPTSGHSVSSGSGTPADFWRSDSRFPGTSSSQAPLSEWFERSSAEYHFYNVPEEPPADYDYLELQDDVKTTYLTPAMTSEMLKSSMPSTLTSTPLTASSNLPKKRTGLPRLGFTSPAGFHSDDTYLHPTGSFMEGHSHGRNPPAHKTRNTQDYIRPVP